MSEVPPSGIYVEVDHPTTGHTWSLNALDSSQFLPNLRGKPTLEAVVPASEQSRWLDADWEGAEPTMRAWEDGQRLPIETLRHVKPSPDGVTLVGEGGSQLDRTIEKEIDQEEAWIAARDGVKNTTSYARNFDDPAPSGSSFEELLQDVAGESELQSFLASSIPDTKPIEFAGGGIRTTPTCATTEGEDYSRESGSTANSDGSYSGGSSRQLDSSGSYIEWDFSFSHDIPSGELSLFVRWESSGSSPPDVEFSLDGTTLITQTSSTSGLVHEDFAERVGWSDPGRVPAGSHTLRAEVTNATGQYQIFDVVSPADGRFSYTLDNTNDGSGGYLDGPQTRPDSVTVDWQDALTAYNVVGARVSSTWTATDNKQAIATSNDQGVSYQSASNTDSASYSFSGPGGQARFRATLGRTGSRTTATPQTGFKPHRMDSFKLYGELEDSAVAQSRRYTTSVMDFLNALARYANSIWELQWDDSAGKISVEWTRYGQRTATSDEALVDYDISKDLRIIEKATVVGASRPRAPESIQANHGTAVALAQDNLLPSSETVQDANSDTEYVANVDYEMSYANGEITTLSGGSITDGQTLSVGYRYEPRASHAADSYSSGDRELPPKKINAISTEREAKQAALRLVQDLDSPLVQAKVVLSRSDAGRSLIDDLLLKQLPTDKRMEIQSIEQRAGKISLQLGSRQQVEEVISDIKNRLSETAQRA